MDRWIFYRNNLLKYIDKDSSILIIGGSEREHILFSDLNFKNFTISNFKPKKYKYNFEVIDVDATKMSYPDNYFDYVITHACIHHMNKPHSAILEMYRVSKIGTLIIEGNESYLMRLSGKLNFSQDFEVASIDKVNKRGGVNETGIPNYVYRWNEREIYKTFSSFEPNVDHKTKFQYENDLENPGIQKNLKKKILTSIMKLCLKVFFIFFTKQQNLMSIYIDKINSKERIFKDF